MVDRPLYSKSKTPQELLKIGERFGELEIIDIRESGRWRKSYLCKCSCGNTKVIGHSLLSPSGKQRPVLSCGCKEHNWGGVIKTESDKRIYNIWYEMNKRCYNPRADNYERYGGAGVTVCDEWKNSFAPFVEWSLANGYEDGLTIDRIDSGKPYSPDNCRWVDYYTQTQNRGLMGNNKTGVNGVSFNKKTKKYFAYITRNKISKNLGSFETLEEAAEAREKADVYFEKHGTIKGLH